MDERPDRGPSHPRDAAVGGTTDASSRLAFLARASETFIAAATEWVVLEQLANLAVPALADWCAIDVLPPGGRLTRVAVVHTDPSKVALAAELERRYPPDMDADHGVGKVLRTGRPELYHDISLEQLRASSKDEQHFELIRKLGGFRSAMIVPLAGHGRILGVMMLVSSEDGRRYGPDDLAFAEALARRAALAISNARLAENVQASEGRLEALVDSLDAVVWEADPSSGLFSFVNKRAEQILGYPVDRWTKEPGFRESIMHPDDVERWRDAYARAGEGSEERDIEYRVLAADGRTVWIRDLFVLLDERGAAQRLRGIMIDVTERVQAQRRAEAEHDVTRALAESATLAEAAPRILEAIGRHLDWHSGALWIADPAADVLVCQTVWGDPSILRSDFGRMTRSNRFARGIGLPGRVWQSGRPAFIPDVVVDDNFPRQAAAATIDLHSALGFPIALRENVIGVVEFFSRQVLDPDDELIASLVTIGTQIGQFLESVEANAALEESHARSRAILGSAHDCFVSMDHEGRVIEFNPAAERTFGYERASVIGKELAEVIVPPEHREAHRAGLARYLEVCEGAYIDQRIETIGMRSDGTTFPIELAVTAVDSSPPLFTASIRDITEQKATQQAVRESRDRLTFLAEASALLTISLNYRTVLDRLANLCVPILADWCAVDAVEDDGMLRRLAVAHADPAKRDVAHRLVGTRPDDGNGQVLRRVLRSGEPVVAADGADACGGNGNDPEQRAIVAQLGCRSAMVVPLVARGRTLGAITLVSAGTEREYGATDLSLAEDVARRAALAVDNARLYQEKSYVARTLQRSLLPPHLPSIPGVEVAARYYAAGEGNEVGGDFYDLFRTAKDDWAILVGDVCGKGADAAALTALARYTVRAAAMQARKPSRVLSSLNEALLGDAATRDSMDQRFCTVAYARVRPTPGGVRITAASGGHPTPLIVHADGSVDPACKVGTLIGVLSDPALSDRSTELVPGDLLVFYTDGIIEARGPEGVFGEDRTRELLASCAGLEARAAAERIERTTLDFQEGDPRDDIALLVVRVLGR